MSKTLDELFASGRESRSRGCPRCGAKNVAAISVRLLDLGENGQIVSKGGRHVSRARSFCAVHAAEFYERLVEEFTQ